MNNIQWPTTINAMFTSSFAHDTLHYEPFHVFYNLYLNSEWQENGLFFSVAFFNSLSEGYWTRSLFHSLSWRLVIPILGPGRITFCLRVNHLNFWGCGLKMVTSHRQLWDSHVVDQNVLIANIYSVPMPQRSFFSILFWILKLALS